MQNHHTVLIATVLGGVLSVLQIGHLPASRAADVPASQMLHSYLMARASLAHQRRDAAYETIKTQDAMQAYQKRMRRFFLARLGELPKRSSLNARIVGRIQRDGYRVEKVIFESQPRFFVTALLYLPDCKPPYPGVLVPCGHSANGKARDLYQRAPILIAKNGMAALCYDPIDQGERHQLLDTGGKPVVTSSTLGHEMTGVGAMLLGRNTATYRIWDGMRALDYLASRPEVDPDRIGCTGISGGGTMTSYLMALDDRIRAAAPGCYLTSFQRLLETIGPQDAEQNIFGQIAHGMDHADYILMRAPRPTLMMTATHDFFDIDGAWHTFRQAKRWYTRLGFAERTDIIEVDGKHGFPPAMRIAATRWMRRWLLKLDDAVTEPANLPVERDEDLQCSPRGEVLLLDRARSVYDLNVELETRLAAQRERFWQTNSPTKALDEVRRVAGIRELDELPKPTWERTGTRRQDGYRIDKLILRPEPGIWLPALAYIPDHTSDQAYLYLRGQGKQADAAGGRIEKLVRQGHVVLAVDVRGIGETEPAGKHSYSRVLPPEWRECTIAYLLGTSLLAMRAEDILVSARWLADGALGEKPKAVHLVSVGQIGPAALHAAALEPDLFASVTLRHCLVSWSSVVRTPLAKNPFANLIHGALRVYDLPDLVRTMSTQIQVTEPVDATGQLVR